MEKERKKKNLSYPIFRPRQEFSILYSKTREFELNCQNLSLQLVKFKFRWSHDFCIVINDPCWAIRSCKLVKYYKYRSVS